MWDRGSRHLPLTPRYASYEDNRPILPQDGTRGYFGFRKLHDSDPLVYYNFKDGIGSSHILCSNIIPAADRTLMREYSDYFQYVQSYRPIASLIPVIIVYGALTKNLNVKPGLKIAMAIGTYFTINVLVQKYVNFYGALFYGQFYAKYSNLATENINEVQDPKRKFFKPDTSVYYRETPQEIYDQKSASQLHDSSIYLGPHPFNDHENVDSIIEINNKFLNGESSYDKENYEKVLGDDIDIKRKIKQLPTVEEFRNI
jgi:hypothetical protein